MSVLQNWTELSWKVFVAELSWKVFVAEPELSYKVCCRTELKNLCCRAEQSWKVCVAKLSWKVFVAELSRKVCVAELSWKACVAELSWKIFVAASSWGLRGQLQPSQDPTWQRGWGGGPPHDTDPVPDVPLHERGWLPHPLHGWGVHHRPGGHTLPLPLAGLQQRRHHA